jgi:hypothetical protein
MARRVSILALITMEVHQNQNPFKELALRKMGEFSLLYQYSKSILPVLESTLWMCCAFGATDLDMSRELSFRPLNQYCPFPWARHLSKAGLSVLCSVWGVGALTMF